MPGHKRSARFEYLSHVGGGLDITEIDGFDDLNCPEEIFADSERLAAELWGSRRCLYSVNGSSGAILASVRAALLSSGSKRVVMARNCHKSVYHAVELCGADVTYIKPACGEYGICLSVEPEEVRRALEKEGSALVIITSPTYEGVLSDVGAISAVCREYGVPLLVDEAHGAHLGLYGIFPDGAVKAGADIVVQSIHKTLPSLTQTALLHVCSEAVPYGEICRQMAIFQTSSPSYLLSASIDGAVRYLASEEGRRNLTEWYGEAVRMRDALCGLDNIRVFRGGDGVYDVDVSKAVLSGGVRLAEYLREYHKVELEMTSASYVIAMTGAGDDSVSLERFVQAVKAADAELGDAIKTPIEGVDPSHVPSRDISSWEAVRLQSERMPLDRAVGCICGEYVYAYPPGVPILVPGETVDLASVENVRALEAGGVSVRCREKGFLDVIKTDE